MLLGPRQTGKSTLVRGQLPANVWTVDLLRHDEYLRYSKDPSEFRLAVEERQRRGTTVVFVDEVQKVLTSAVSAHRDTHNDHDAHDPR